MKLRRIDLIIKELEENGIVSVDELSKKFNVTKMTIGRDLKTLENSNVLTKVYGGAILKENSKFDELTRIEKKDISTELKRFIGQKASTLIENGDIIFAGASTTNEFLVEEIKNKGTHVRIITNSYYIFDAYRGEKSFELVLLGGEYRDKSGAFIGEYANKMAALLDIDKCFIGVNGIKDNQITNTNQHEASLQKIVMERSKKKYVVADSSKFDLKDLYCFFSTDHIDGIITDSKIGKDTYERYSKLTKIFN